MRTIGYNISDASRLCLRRSPYRKVGTIKASVPYRLVGVLKAVYPTDKWEPLKRVYPTEIKEQKACFLAGFLNLKGDFYEWSASSL